MTPPGSSTAPAGAAADAGAALAWLLALRPADVSAAAASWRSAAQGLADAAHVLDGYEPQWRGGARAAADGARARRGGALRSGSGAFHAASTALGRHADVVADAWVRAGVLSRSVDEHDALLASGVADPVLLTSRAGLLAQAESWADAVASSGRAAALALGAAAQGAPTSGGAGQRAWAAAERSIVSWSYGTGEVVLDSANVAVGAATMFAAFQARQLGVPVPSRLRDADEVYRRRTAAAWETIKDDPEAAARAVVNLPLLRSDPARWGANLATGAWITVGTEGLMAPVATGARAGRALSAAQRLVVAGRSGIVGVREVAREAAQVAEQQARRAALEHPVPPPPLSRPPGPALAALPGEGGAAVVGTVAGAAAMTGYQLGVAAVAARRTLATAGGTQRVAAQAVARTVDRGLDAAVDARVHGGRAAARVRDEALGALRAAGVAVREDARRLVVDVAEGGWRDALVALDAAGASVRNTAGAVGDGARLLAVALAGPGEMVTTWLMGTALVVEVRWKVHVPSMTTAAALAHLRAAALAQTLARTHLAAAGVVVQGWTVTAVSGGWLVAQRLGLVPPGGVRATMVWSAGQTDTVAGAGGLATRNAQDERAAMVRDAERLERELALSESAATGALVRPAPSPGPALPPGPPVASAPRALVGVG